MDPGATNVRESYIGRTFSHYRILQKIGEGGMGVVYEAEDLKLGRHIALKFLQEDADRSSDRLLRFQREARAASALNHPHICTIYEIDQADGCDFIAMELLQGQSLREKILHRALSTDEILQFGIELAEALQAAHAASIFHRDIKPENIFVTNGGHIKILDFGVAKLDKDLAEATPDAGTATDAAPLFLTRAGITVGTLGYMSPEQLRGQPIDQRSDLFSFGAVLYEMATGKPPFSGDSTAALIDAVLNRKSPRPTSLNHLLPIELEQVIEKALEKDREVRYQSAAEMRADLRRLQRYSSSETPVSGLATRSKIGLSLGALLVLLLAAVAFFIHQRKPAPSVSRAEYQQVTNFSESAFAPAISPDGRMLAFMVGPGGFGYSASAGDVYVKLLPDGEAVRLTRNPDSKQTLHFSPDGSRIAYTTLATRLTWNTMESPVLGGEARMLLPNATGLTWIDDKQLLYSTIDTGEHMGIVTSNESRSSQRRIYFPPTGIGMAHQSSLSPDKKWVLVVEMDGAGWLPCRLVPFDGLSMGRSVGPQNGQCTAAAWSPDGAWMYFSSNQGGEIHLWRQAFPGGAPEQLTSGATEEEGIAMAPDGKSLYTSVGTAKSSIWLHDQKGDRQITEQGYAYLPTFSPDGNKLYYLVRNGKSRSYVQGQLWVTDLATQKNEKLFPDFVMTHYAISNDGSKVVYTTASEEGAGIWIADLSRRSSPRQLTKGGEYRVFFGGPGELIYQGHTNDSHLFRMAEDGGNPEQISPDTILHLISVSPDGKWAVVAAPASNDQANEIKVYPLSGIEPPSILCDVCIAGFGPTRTGAPMLSWSRDGKILFASLRYFGRRSRNTLVLPLHPGQRPPNLTNGKTRTDEELARMPGAYLIHEEHVFPGPGSTYAASRNSAQSNIYRIILP